MAESPQQPYEPEPAHAREEERTLERKRRMRNPVITDEHIVDLPNGRVAGALGYLASSFRFAWLASHRGRLRTAFFCGRRVAIFLTYDEKGFESARQTDKDVSAIAQLAWGDDGPS